METIGANVFVETVYPGVNTGCIISREGSICVDTPFLPGEAQRWATLIRSLGGAPIRFVIYTNGQRDRILGTQYLLESEPFSGHPQAPAVQQVSGPQRILFPTPPARPVPERRQRTTKGAVVAQRQAWNQVKEYQTEGFKQSLLDTFGDRDPDMEKLQIILPQVTFSEQIRIFVGEVTAVLLAAASGVAWVWLPQQQVLFVGDTLVVGTHPPLNAMNIREWLTALERLRREPAFQDAVIVPGRGPVTDADAASALINYLHMAFFETRRVYRSGRPKGELNEIAGELLGHFPVADGQRERVQRQIKLGLDDLYDQFKADNTALS
jgi:glyoxylase-like metal-dependent hydrolase (beta-lactamase superfamily II)